MILYISMGSANIIILIVTAGFYFAWRVVPEGYDALTQLSKRFKLLVAALVVRPSRDVKF
jgi:hypothetical protein